MDYDDVSLIEHWPVYFSWALEKIYKFVVYVPPELSKIESITFIGCS